ncbi:MAG: hypothetical protein JSR58_03090 [Verrucomicrobia bacterium]|nr:hypothetical protein [Verrucomicrobiota bacterium]
MATPAPTVDVTHALISTRHDRFILSPLNLIRGRQYEVVEKNPNYKPGNDVEIIEVVHERGFFNPMAYFSDALYVEQKKNPEYVAAPVPPTTPSKPAEGEKKADEPKKESETPAVQPRSWSQAALQETKGFANFVTLGGVNKVASLFTKEAKK